MVSSASSLPSGLLGFLYEPPVTIGVPVELVPILNSGLSILAILPSAEFGFTYGRLATPLVEFGEVDVCWDGVEDSFGDIEANAN